MAKMAVDRIVERDSRDAPCRTQEIPLGQAVDPAALARVEGVAPDAYASLASRYGHQAQAVLALAASQGRLAAPIVDGHPDLLAEAVWAARREQAATLGDVLLRRTRLGLLAARAVTEQDTLERVAGAVGDELGWDPARRATEVADFLAESAAEGIVVGAVVA
jgi:glycerol-3-phosphate dehydrogenase